MVDDKLQLVDMAVEDTQMNMKDEWHRLWHAAAAGEKKKKERNDNAEELGISCGAVET